MTSILDQLQHLAGVLAVTIGDVVVGATLVALILAVGLVELETAAEDRRRAASAARRRASETWNDVRPMRTVVPEPIGPVPAVDRIAAARRAGSVTPTVVRELPRPLPRIARIPATPRPGSVPPVPPTAVRA